jgi:hypothetical protein
MLKKSSGGRTSEAWGNLSPHVKQMLASIQTHRSEVTAMSEEDISEPREWHDVAVRDCSQAVAYFFDY